jgi:hypothetical protein
MNNPRMIIGLSVLLCLYLAFGLMGCAEACNAEERAYDKRAPGAFEPAPGECVRARQDYPTRAAGWLAAVRAQQARTTSPSFSSRQ